MLKEIQGLKCPNHDLIRDNYYFRYQEAYPGARPLNSTRSRQTCVLSRPCRILRHGLCPLRGFWAETAVRRTLSDSPP